VTEFGDSETPDAGEEVLATTAHRVRLPHDRASDLWMDDSPSPILTESMERWVRTLLEDDGYRPIGQTRVLVRARVIAKQEGVLCGSHVVNHLLKTRLPDVQMSWHKREGERFQNDDTLLILDGAALEILAVERVLINLIGRMSGIATETERWVNRLNGLRVASTRKTAWGILDKWAVHIGGGLTHRLRKSDAWMIKENDQTVLKMNLEESKKETMQKWIATTDLNKHGAFTVIEVDSISMANVIAKAWCNRMMETEEDRILVIMLDNMGPAKTKEAVLDIQSHGYDQWICTEASGNIRFEDLDDWMTTGVDVLSTSSMNMGVRSIDISMLIDESGVRTLPSED